MPDRMSSWLVAGLFLFAGCSDPSRRTTRAPTARATPDAGSAPLPAAPAFTRVARPNPIPAENARPGSPDWRDGLHSRGPEIELYADVDSGFAGDTIAIKAQADIETEAVMDVYRLGEYGGAGARRVWSGGPYPVGPQAPCPRDARTSRVECDWNDTASFQIGSDWVSGLYLIRARRTDGHIRFTPFVVRDDRAADILFNAAFTTYQAYNIWGGESLYYDGSGTMPNGRAYEVSFNRPYIDYDGSGQLLHMEYPLLRFLERHGYDVTYGSNLDFARFEGFAQGVGLFLHGGHDEYWTDGQRTEVEALLTSGETSLAHFGGNGAYWRIRLEPDARGKPLRTVVCYKNEAEKDPQPHSTIRFRDEPNARPENALFGTMYDNWQLKAFPLVVKDGSHWLLEGTGLTTGDLLPNLLGYEFDKVMDNGWTPPGLSIPFESAVLSAEGTPSRSQVVERTLPNGRLVFSAGTIYWPLGLSLNEYQDSRVERMTRNVLERALTHRRTPEPLAPAQGPMPKDPPPIAAWAKEVRPFAGMAGSPGWKDGPAPTATFNGPTGIATGPALRIYVADTLNNAIRMIDSDPERTVRTLAGDGRLGHRDGPGTEAMFRAPTGVAVDNAGVIYVADSDNHVIRRIENDPPHWTVSTYAGAPRAEGHADGIGAIARFSRPTSIALDAAGNLYVADQAGHRIRIVEASTREVRTLAGSGAAGDADAAEGWKATFNHPSAIAVATNGDLYVVDGGNNRIRRVSATPPHAVTTLAGDPTYAYGFLDGPGHVAKLRAQMGLAFGGLPHQLYFADTASFRIRKLEVGENAETSNVFTIAGSGRQGSALGPAFESDIVAPAGLSYTPAETLLVTDSFNHVIREIVW